MAFKAKIFRFFTYLWRVIKAQELIVIITRINFVIVLVLKINIKRGWKRNTIYLHLLAAYLPSSLFIIIIINNYQLILHLILLYLLPIFPLFIIIIIIIWWGWGYIVPISKTVKIKRLTKINRKSKSSINMLSQYYIKHLWKKKIKKNISLFITTYNFNSLTQLAVKKLLKKNYCFFPYIYIYIYTHGIN